MVFLACRRQRVVMEQKEEVDKILDECLLCHREHSQEAEVGKIDKAVTLVFCDQTFKISISFVEKGDA